MSLLIKMILYIYKKYIKFVIDDIIKLFKQHN